MKIESFRINLAVADNLDRNQVLRILSDTLNYQDKSVGIFFVEIEVGVEGFEKLKTSTPLAALAAEPRKKRKYTRKAKPAAESGAEQRIKNADGTTTIRRGNIPAGGNAS